MLLKVDVPIAMSLPNRSIMSFRDIVVGKL
jgi:hypothetical protein